MDLKAVKVGCGRYIDSLQLFFSTGSNNLISGPKAGGDGGCGYMWTVPNEQYVIKVILKTGGLVDSIQFVTNTGLCSPKFGGMGGNEKVINVPEGSRIVGFFGRCGKLLVKVGFVFGSRA